MVDSSCTTWTQEVSKRDFSGTIGIRGMSAPTPNQVGLVEPCFFLIVMKQLPGLVLHKPHPSKHLRLSENRVPVSSPARLLIKYH